MGTGVSVLSKAELERTISCLVAEAPENRLADCGGQVIFDEPMVGVASGDDPLFELFRQVVSPRHLLPRDLVLRYSPAGTVPASVSVASWVLPFSQEIRRANHCRDWPSRLYSLARNNGGALSHAVLGRLTQILRGSGWVAVAPALGPGYDAFRCGERTFSSSWSEMHVAYAAGLGQFGLSGCLITPLGVHVRLASLATNLPLEPTPRPYATHRAPCLEVGGEGCGVCIERCPVGAISRGGLDKSKCYAMRNAVRERCLARYKRELHMLRAPIVKAGARHLGYSLGCALCQCGVPCEGRFPNIALDGSRLYA